MSQRFRCYYDGCQKHFRSKIYLVCHVNSYHLKINVFSCQHCEFHFNSEAEFKEHQSIHVVKTCLREPQNNILLDFALTDSYEYTPVNILSLPVLPSIETERKSKAFQYKLPISVSLYECLAKRASENK